MSEARFDVEAVFDDDYRYFYDPALTPERTAREADLIWRLLDLKEKSGVLDLACGHGRIANALAQRGADVVGLDVTPAFLEQARHDVAALGVNVDYVLGDMRSLPWTDRFDGVAIWFTAFGYFDDDANQMVLAEVYRALKAGGKLVIEINNRDRILQTFQHASLVERDGNYMIDRHRYDVPSGRVETERIVVRDGGVRRMRFFVRLFTFPELATWLRQAGFRDVRGFDQDGQPLGLDSRRMVVVADRKC
jgi:SAM-dependent methyltransferase